jgi:hypothetical protein
VTTNSAHSLAFYPPLDPGKGVECELHGAVDEIATDHQEGSGTSKTRRSDNLMDNFVEMYCAAQATNLRGPGEMRRGEVDTDANRHRRHRLVHQARHQPLQW